VEPDAEERSKMYKFAAALESSSRQAAMLSLAATEKGIIVPPDAFDSDPFKFNVQNGTLRFDPERKTVELLPHNPEDLITNISPAVWEGVIPPRPVFGKYLEESAGGDQELIAFRRRLAGYAMTGDMREQIFEYAYGPEAGGKGTETRARTDVLGTYARAAEMETFLTSRSDKVRNDLAGLVGARMVTATETQEAQVLDEGLIRMLTGQDRMTARFLFKENFEFSCGFKIRFEGNHRPHIKSVGGATWRRLLIVPFERTVRRRDATILGRVEVTGGAVRASRMDGRRSLEWLRDGLNLRIRYAAVAAYRLAKIA
jgi:putative DNA primase/helicase